MSDENPDAATVTVEIPETESPEPVASDTTVVVVESDSGTDPLLDIVERLTRLESAVDEVRNTAYSAEAAASVATEIATEAAETAVEAEIIAETPEPESEPEPEPEPDVEPNREHPWFKARR